MIRLKELITEIMNATPSATPPVPAIQSSTNAYGFDASFVDYIKSMENPNKEGYHNGKWYPHKMPDGSPSIGYGHLIKKSEVRRMATGVNDIEVEKLLKDDLIKAKKGVYDYIEQTYKVNLKLPTKTEEMLMDFSYNLGGLKKFPKFVDAVLRGEMDKARAEYKRFYHTPTGEKRIMNLRNKSFFDRYLK
jgi:GH24 family phage-related lysozyme (muramidase)